MSSSRLALPLLILSLFLFASAHATTPGPSDVQFKHWYPTISRYMEDNLQGPCKQNLTNYYNTSYHYPDCQQCRGQALINCLITSLDPVTQASMGSASVLLGLLPTILSYVGPSYVEVGLLAQRRLLLALLVAAGSPAVSPIRTIDYQNPKQLLELNPGSIAEFEPTGGFEIVVSALEYTVVFAAIANLIVVTWQLCIRTICNFGTNIIWFPVLWPAFAVLIHIVAMIAVRSKVRFRDKTEPAKRPSRIRQELSLCLNHPRTVLKTQEESPWFLATAWIVSTGTVLHIILGTLVFSSLLFLLTKDAITVAVQYIASTLVCKMVLVYELAGLRKTVEVEVGEDDRTKTTILKHAVSS